MWSVFRKKSDTSADAPGRPGSQFNRVEGLADSLQREGRTGELEAHLQGLDQTSFSSEEQESWWHVYGIVAFQDGRDAEALERFREAAQRFPDSAKIKFSLGQQCIRAGSVEKGLALFRDCKFPGVSREYALAQARYAYLWSRYDDAVSFLQPFFLAYKKAKILDDHFLYVRGLPPFETSWSYLAAFSILSGEFSELESVMKFVRRHSHDHDVQRLENEWGAHRDDKPEYLLKDLEKQLGEQSGAAFANGYTRMNIAVIRARMARGIQEGKDHLERVALSERDFPWLEDVRILALAQTARRFGDAALEQKFKSAFLERQPLLFEPNIALSFHLLRYQEELKPAVRSDGRALGVR